MFPAAWRSLAIVVTACILAGYAPLFASASSNMPCCKGMHACCKKSSGVRLETTNCCLPGGGLQKATLSTSAALAVADLTVHRTAVATLSTQSGDKHPQRLIQFALHRFQRPPPPLSLS